MIGFVNVFGKCFKQDWSISISLRAGSISRHRMQYEDAAPGRKEEPDAAILAAIRCFCVFSHSSQFQALAARALKVYGIVPLRSDC